MFGLNGVQEYVNCMLGRLKVILWTIFILFINSKHFFLYGQDDECSLVQDYNFNSIRTLKLSQVNIDSLLTDKSLKNFFLVNQINILTNENLEKIDLNYYNRKDLDKKEQVFLHLLKSETPINYHEENKSDSISFSHLLTALEISKKIGNEVLQCESLKRICKFHLKNQQDVISFHNYANLYKEKAYDDFEKVFAEYYYFGSILGRKYEYGDLDIDPLPEALKALKLAENKNFDYLAGRLSQIIGVYHDLILNDFKGAFNYYTNAISNYKKISYYFGIKQLNDLSYNLSMLEFENGNYSKSIRFLNQIKLELIESMDVKDLILINNGKYQNYKRLNQLDSAILYLEKRSFYVDSLELVEKGKYVTNLETQYRTAEKEKQILQEQQKVRINRNWLIAASLALFLGTGIAILLQKNTTKKRLLAEKEALLKQQRVENLLKEQELVSIDAMIAGQEKERQKVAGELHDDLGSLMATIKLHFDNVKISEQDPALSNAQKLLEEAYQKVRGMAHNKNSGVMSDQGLLAAIKKMAKTIGETNTLKVTVEDFGLGERMENSLELSIFRMVQELVANAIKHAEASKVNIQLTQHEENLNIIVEDNGKGFDRSQLDKESNGMGLTNIEKRVEHLEGNFTVDSILGKGTSILIDIPV